MMTHIRQSFRSKASASALAPRSEEEERLAEVDGARLQARVANLQREVAQCRASAAQSGRLAMEQQRVLDEEQAKLAEDTLELQAVRRQLAEAGYVAERTAAFAEARGRSAAALLEAVGDLRGRGAGLSTCLTTQRAVLAAAREQVRAANSAGEDKLPSLDAGIRSVEVAGASAVANMVVALINAQKAMDATAGEQQDFLKGVSTRVQETVGDLTQAVARACHEACAASPAAREAEALRIDALGAAAQGFQDAASCCSDLPAEAVTAGMRALMEQADLLQEKMRAGGQAHAGAARGLGVEVKDASVVASAGDEAVVRTFRECLREPVRDLCGLLTGASQDAQHHRSASALAVERFSAASLAAAVRRSHFRDALSYAVETQVRGDAKVHSEFQHALSALREILAARGAAADAQQGHASQHLEDIRSELVDIARDGEAAVHAAAKSAGATVGDFWERENVCLESLAACFKGVVTQPTEDNCQIAAPPAVLLEALAQLAKVRESLDQDVAILRQQAEAERATIAALKEQQRDLDSEMGELRGGLKEVNSQLQSRREAISTMQEEQAARGQASVQAIGAQLESVLRRGFQDIGEMYAAESTQPALHMHKARALLGDVEKILSVAEERAAGLNGDAEALLEEWERQHDESCERIVVSEYQAATANVRAQAISAAAVEGITISLGRMQAADTAAQKAWASSADAVTQAAVAWGAASRILAPALGEAFDDAAAARDEVVWLRQEASLQRLEACDRVDLMAAAHRAHAEDLSDIIGDHVADCMESNEVDARQHQIFLMLHDKLAKQEPVLANCARIAEGAMDASTLDALFEHWQTLGQGLCTTESAATGIVADIQGTSDRAGAQADKLRSLNTETSEAVRRIMGEAARAASADALSLAAAAAAEAQRQRASGLAHELGHAKVEAAVKAVAGELVQRGEAVASHVEAVAAQLGEQAKESRAKAEAAIQRQAVAVYELASLATKELKQRTALWRDGLVELSFDVSASGGAVSGGHGPALVLPPHAAAALRACHEHRLQEYDLVKEFRQLGA